MSGYITISKEKGIKAILGIWEDSDGKHSEVSSYLFDKETWSRKDAKEWVEEHKSDGHYNIQTSIVKAEIIDVEDVSDEQLAKAGLEKNKDLLYTSLILCHANVNSNIIFKCIT